MTASIQSRRGNSPPQRVWSQSPPKNPGARRHRGRECLDAGDEFLTRCGVPEVHRRQPESALEKMDVRVDEAGRDELPAKIDNFRTPCRAADIVGAADEGDAVAGERDSFSIWMEGIPCPDPRVHQRQCDRRLCRRDALLCIHAEENTCTKPHRGEPPDCHAPSYCRTPRSGCAGLYCGTGST